MNPSHTVEEVVFPHRGVNTEGEFGTQPSLTTAEATNVVNFDTLARRMRGGSRPMLTPFLPQLPSGANVIQHLEVIVDPTVPALAPSWTGGPFVEDPSNNGRAVLDNGETRKIPPGGSGFYTHVEYEQPPDEEEEPGEITFYQEWGKRGVAGGEETFNFEMNFDLEVQLGNLIVFVVMTTEENSGSSPDHTVTVTNLAGDPYTRLDSAGVGGGYQRVTPNEVSPSQLSLSVWYKVVATADDYEVKFNPGADVSYEVRFLEYAGAAGTAFSGFSFGGDAGPVTALETGEYTLGSAGQMSVACYATDRISSSASYAITGPDGYEARGNGTDAVRLNVFDDVDRGQEANHNPAATAAQNAAYVSVGFGVFAA